jgi:hypothetical protein
MTPEQTLPRPKLTYAIFGAVFGICFPLIVLFQNFPADLFNPKSTTSINEGFFVMLGVFVVWALWCLLTGALVGMLVGLLIEKITKNRIINAILMSGIGAFVWAIVMAILGLGVPALLVLVVVLVVGQSGFAAMFVLAIGVIALFTAVIMLIPTSIFGFTLSTVITGQMAKRVQMKTFHYFLAAASIAVIFCGIAIVLRIIAIVLR